MKEIKALINAQVALFFRESASLTNTTGYKRG